MIALNIYIYIIIESTKFTSSFPFVHQLLNFASNPNLSTSVRPKEAASRQFLPRANRWINTAVNIRRDNWYRAGVADHWNRTRNISRIISGVPDRRLGRAARRMWGGRRGERARFVCSLLDAIMIRGRSAESRWLLCIEGGGALTWLSGTMADVVACTQR